MSESIDLKQAYFDLVESYRRTYDMVIRYNKNVSDLMKRMDALEEYLKIRFVEETIDAHYKKKEV